MSRPARIALWTGAGFLALLLGVVVALLVVPNTDWGRALLVQEVARLSQGKVRIAGLRGRFPAALDLDRLELSDADGVWLWAEHVALRWSPGALLTRHIDIDSLHVALLHVERTPAADKEPAASSSSSVPDTDLQDLTVGTLELGEKLTGHPAALTVQARAHLRSLDDADLHLTASRIAGDGQYVVDGHFDPKSLNATVNLHEPAHGPLAALVQWPDAGAITVQATLAGPREAEALQLSVDVGPMQARAQGHLDLNGKSADLHYSLAAPPMSPVDGVQWQRIALQGELHGPWTLLEAQGTLQVDALQAPGGTRVTAIDATLAGNQGVLHLTAGIDGLHIPGPAPKLLEASRLNVDATVHLDDAARPVVLTASHRLFALSANAKTAGDLNADMNLRLPDLKPFGPLSGATLRGDAQLTAHVDYAPASIRATADLSTHLDGGDAAWLGAVRGGLTQAHLKATVTEQRIDLEDVRVTAPGVSFTGNATTQRQGDQAVAARFDARVPNLRRLSAALAGELTLNGELKGPHDKLAVDTRLHTNLSVRGSPSAALSARIQAQGLPQTPNGVIDAQGELDGAPLRVNAEVKSGKPGEYRAIIRQADWKSAHAQGDVTFADPDAAGSVAFRLGDLSDLNRLVGQPLAGTLAGQLRLGSEAHRPTAHLELEASDIQAGGVTGHARLEADGPTRALQVKLDADSPALAGSPVTVAAAALLNLDAKELALNTLQAAYRDQQLRLLNPASVQFASEVRVHQLNLGLQQATLSIDGQLAPTLDVHATVQHVQPALVNAFVPNLLASGEAGVEATLRGTTAAPSGSIRLQALNLRAMSADARGLPPTDLRTQVTLNDGQADIDASLTAGTDSHLALTGRAGLAADGNVDLKLAGNINLALANPILEAAGRRVTGTVQVDTEVTGASATPRIAGTVRISNASVRDYAQGLSLTDITGALSGDQSELRIEQLTARAAPGTIAVQGTVGILQPGLPVDVHVSAKNAQPIASNLVTANLNADVQISGKAREDLEVNGKIHLNHAELNIPGGLPPEVAVLDVERDGAPPASASQQALVTHLHIDVDAPNRILIKGRGLDAELGGQLHVTGTAQTPRVDGGFELQRGFFTLANSKLTFTAGTVTFNGSGLQQKLDPSLDFTAQSKAAEVTATVHITGLADAPQIALSSSPELPPDEILARLLFGQPAAQLSALELVETGVALASLRGGGNGPSLNPIDRVQKALGLDRLSVGSASTPSTASSSTEQKSQTTVEAGRYLSSRVYVGVKEGSAGASQVDVDIDLTRNLKLQAQLGNGSTTAQGVTPENDPGSSLGLAYQFEY